MRVWFFGPRAFQVQDLPLLEAYIQTLDPEQDVIYAGGAQGFDISAQVLGVKHGFQTRILYPCPSYPQYYYAGKGYRRDYIGRPETARALGAHELVQVRYAQDQWSRNVNFLRNTALAEYCDRAVTLEQQCTGGTAHALSETFRLGVPVTFLR